MDLRLNGKRALVTGGSQGIGHACATVLAEEGCSVLVAARNPKSSNSLPIDLTQPKAAERLADWAKDVDILVNCAGAVPHGDLQQIDDEKWRAAWELKVFGYINVTRAVYARMKARRSGVIINIIGAAGERSNPTFIAGSTGNAALMAFTKALGAGSPNDGIRVLGINPGSVGTERTFSRYRMRALNELGSAERYPELFTSFPFGRVAKPEEIAWAVAFLASERSGYTSGTVLTVDGGLSSRP